MKDVYCKLFQTCFAEKSTNRRISTFSFLDFHIAISQKLNKNL